MEISFLIAGALAAFTGMAHSVLGERLIFTRLRNGGLVPNGAAPPISERHTRILWATWHIASVFGLAFAGVLIKLALSPSGTTLRSILLIAIISAYLGSSILVLIGTKGKHPGWIALLAVAVLTWLGAGSS